MTDRNTTHFGFQEVGEDEKAQRVADVFDSVAQRYDLMNDLMSGGLHRLWKAFAIAKSGVRAGARVLDVAGGTGDLALAFSRKLGDNGQVWLTDINNAMLTRGRDRLCDKGALVHVAQCDAESLPFPDEYFDCVTVAFGLRNMTHKERALAEMQRVLRAGGRLLVLEFSQVWKPLAPAYDFYSFKVIPRIGQIITQDEASYRYLAESIRVHPDQQGLKLLMEQAGFERVEFFNLALGVVALHRGFKF
ncbi:bifunctional demethylmenaquinone methyltransferase/2-methoxy-6-polyprenyl-1,4-benzoquinol methylase UbiE [Candidatus Accumulibacter sp. ACC003]|uniref:bifunctional demethylmenaquinone methyltransferase/2-methoxy-6-polyprenyl-1,4-benzoquinol methylase UbiE n=1 Tax=Candidatus Accumulibacter sp. ACC003 TaxID=2823334 RepID=UPI0025C1F057|nr:bifunctional demethylmenaquinone methyltransferase/2-methoxy-6-polyprenyl-1,4-benzoquinol methylase UbiE [Candidatus Accumulibacter sp. ACC003]